MPEGPHYRESNAHWLGPSAHYHFYPITQAESSCLCLPDLPVAQNFALVLQEFRIRQATPEDAAVIGWHRARMFQDMGLVPDKLFESYRTKALDRLSQALASGDYVG